MNHHKTSKGFTIFLIFLIIAFLVWGFFGGKHIQKKGIECEIGISDKFCWSWSTENPLLNIEKTDERIRNVTDSTLTDFLNIS